MTVSPADIAFLREFVHRRSAIVLEPDKDYLVEARLEPVARHAGLADVSALIDKLRSGSAPGLPVKVVEAMTTNETTFFRDAHPFETLEKLIVPQLLTSRASTRTITIWSAACSTGQEPYSIAMMLAHTFPELRNWQVRIIASDLAESVLARAREGRYRAVEVNRGLPKHYLSSYFEPFEQDWRVRDVIRKRVEFVQLNLHEMWTHPVRFDVVFLRNVLIYFDVPTKQRILARVRQFMAPDGALFLGGAETTANLDSNYSSDHHGKTVFFRPTK